MVDHRRAAVVALDEAIAHRPRKHDAAFAQAVEQVCRLRDELQQAGDRAGRDRVNGALSLVLAGCFPLDQVPWTEVVAARNVLAAAEPVAPPPEDRPVSEQVRHDPAHQAGCA